MTKMKKKATKKKAAKKKTAQVPQSAADREPPKVETSPMPTAGSRVTEFQRRLDEQISEHPKPAHGGARSGAGRPPKPDEKPDPEPQTVAPAIVTAAMGELIQVPFDAWSVKAGLPELKLSPAEVDMLIPPVQTLLDYYLPLMKPIDWAWASLGLTAVAVMRPRIMLLQSLQGTGQGPQHTTEAAERKPPRGVGPQPVPDGQQGHSGAEFQPQQL